ncbi:MAG: enoyl-CoA hydratase [Solirubrobacterales bacterium]|jgi:2-(1,2-epoxy-1,2-dihydrophenyl)acetyl-CoA isomerase|nr:enoyl-CoA hydratase [Solirubrobacterales bacterium]
MSTPTVDYETVGLSIEGGVATVVMNRPDALNALNMRLKEELAEVWRILVDRSDVRAVLLTGAGRAFSTGGDIKQMDPDRGPEVTRKRMAKLLRDTVIPLARLEKPVVAAVNGHAHGLGLSLALACDIVYAAESAIMSMAFTRVGLAPDGGASYFLPRLVGLSRAKELMFTGRRLSAAEALELGLVSRVLPDEELLPAALELANELGSGATIALGAAKRLLNESSMHTIEEMAELEAFGQAVAMSSEDHREGIAAFAERRKPLFRGC